MKTSELNRLHEFEGLTDLSTSWTGRAAEGGLRVPLPAAEAEGKGEQPARISLGSAHYRLLLILGDLMFVMLSGLSAIEIKFRLDVRALYAYAIAISATLVVYPLALYVFDLYNLDRTVHTRETTLRSSLTVIAAGAVSLALFYMWEQGVYGRKILAIQMCLAWLLLTGWRWAYGAIFHASGIGKAPALIVGAGRCGKTICELLGSPFSPYNVRGFLDDDPAKLETRLPAPILGTVDQLESVAGMEGAATAILAIPKNRSETLIRNILGARLWGINVREMADVYEELTGRIPIRYIGDEWLLSADGFSLLHKEYVQKTKRLVDIVSSALLLTLGLPLFGLTALAVRLDSPGPVFYKQERVGKRQKNFTIYKFRSMRDNAESNGALWAAKNDPRVTRVGRLLRLTRIDELPQIWNVFKGDMSLVGPRPERPEFVRMLEKTVPYYGVRHAVRPGITGWAQVTYRYGASIEDAVCKLEADLYYIKNMSPLLDLKIMLRTIGVVFLADGAR